MIEVFKGDAEILLQSKWWIGKSDLEIVMDQLYVKGLILICDYQVFLTALGNVFNRHFTEAGPEIQQSLINELEKNILRTTTE